MAKRAFSWKTFSLTQKLVIALSLPILLGSLLFWQTEIQTERAAAMRDLLLVASSFTDMVSSSLHHDMLAARGDDIQQTIEAIGASGAVENVRIFGCRGMVHYSSTPAEIGSALAGGAGDCSGCHDEPGGGQAGLSTVSRWTINREQELLTYVEPIYNQSSCSTASCHSHPAGQPVLGLLMTDISLAPLEQRLQTHVFRISAFLLVSLAAVAAVLTLVLWRLVLRPVSCLAVGMEQLASAKGVPQVQAVSEDEIGRLARTFNRMAGELAVARERMEHWAESLEQEVGRKTEEIASAQHQLIESEKLAALGRLTADIAHEIRNPLTALGGFARRLEKVATNEQQKKYTAILVSEVDRLETILRDTLTFSREPSLHFKTGQLKETVRRCLELYELLCRDQSIEIVTELQASTPVLLDRDQVQQAVSNLISNAVDAMPAGGTLTVRTTTEMREGVTFLALQIGDSGPGVPEEKLPFLFEPFYTTKKIGHGTGLGLSIVRKIIEGHHGFIKAENRPEGGLLVTLFFPYQDEREAAKVPCWQFMHCRRDRPGPDGCPAYPEFGRSCWLVAGTRCHGKVQGSFAQKRENCAKCLFYQELREQEEETLPRLQEG